MQLKNYNTYFFLIILLGITFLVFFLMKSFIVPFVLAIVLANLFGFIYEGFLKITRQSKGTSSALTCLVVVLIIIIPIIFVSFLVVTEAQNTIVHFSQETSSGESVINKALGSVSAWPIISTFGGENFVSEEAIINVIKSYSQNALFIFQGVYSGTVNFIFIMFIMFFSLFYLLIDGHDFIKKIMKISPLRNKYEEVLVQKFSSIARATLKGTSLVAIIQGTMGGVLFWSTGVTAPVLLGILMTFSSMIPSVGSGLVWLPVGLIMLLMGNVTEGIVILSVGAFIISTVDNILKPKLVGRDTQIHPLFILLSTLGGLSIFGLPGFIIGPIIIALFISLWEIYVIEFKDQLKEFNR